MEALMKEQAIAQAIALLKSGAVSRVLGWKRGEFVYDVLPAVFETVEELERDFVYNVFCGANLSKYLIAETMKRQKESSEATEGQSKIAVFLKPCDSYSFVQLQKEHRIRRESVFAIGISCNGTCNIEKIKALGYDGVLSVTEEGESLRLVTLYGEHTISKASVLWERCAVCKSKKIVDYDELIGTQGEVTDSARFDEVTRLEALTSKERYDFWQKELSRCIRCNACRNVCPACSCEKCVFDNADSGVKNIAATDSFEENMFHIIRAFHVASRCTDCGECSRVCPQHIPLHLLNRKFIKDINEYYGTYQAGADFDSIPPLLDFKTEDPEVPK